MSDNKIVYLPVKGWRKTLRSSDSVKSIRLPSGRTRFEGLSFFDVSHVVAECFEHVPREQTAIYFTAAFAAPREMALSSLETRLSVSNDTGDLILPFNTCTASDLPEMLAAYALEAATGARESTLVCSAHNDGAFDLHSDWTVDLGLSALALNKGKHLAARFSGSPE